MFTCPRCRRTSYHPEDERNRYCSACKLFFNQLAQLFFTWHELDTIGGLIDKAIGYFDPSTSPGPWSELNSLRTAVREAQSGLMITG